jgi:hypothetical protein
VDRSISSVCAALLTAASVATAGPASALSSRAPSSAATRAPAAVVAAVAPSAAPACTTAAFRHLLHVTHIYGFHCVKGVAVAFGTTPDPGGALYGGRGQTASGVFRAKGRHWVTAALGQGEAAMLVPAQLKGVTVAQAVRAGAHKMTIAGDLYLTLEVGFCGVKPGLCPRLPDARDRSWWLTQTYPAGWEASFDVRFVKGKLTGCRGESCGYSLAAVYPFTPPAASGRNDSAVVLLYKTTAGKVVGQTLLEVEATTPQLTVEAASNTLIALRSDRQGCAVAFKGAGAGRFVETYAKCAVSSGNGTVTWTEQSGAIVVPSS